MAPTKILLTTDGSEGAASATRMALKLSRTLGSKLHAAYVEPMPDPSPGPRPRFSIRKT
jgi:nucleotide-binding universal stress UspA family protein